MGRNRGVPILRTKLVDYNTVRHSPTHCKNETRLCYYFIKGYHGCPRGKGNYYHGYNNRNIGIETYFPKNIYFVFLSLF